MKRDHEIELTDLTKKYPPQNSGLWQLHRGTLELVLSIRPRYRVDLERCKTSAQILDWIAQVAGKPWATPEVCGELVLALDDYLDLQGNFCSGGVESSGVKHIHSIIEMQKVLLDLSGPYTTGGY